MRKIKVIFINLGLRRPLYPLATPPMGIMYLSAYLRNELKSKVEVRLINQRLENWTNEKIVREVNSFLPDIIAISTLTTFAYLLPGLVSLLREACPKSWIVLGGPHASSVRGEVFDTADVDMVVPGEGEVAFKMIVESYPDKALLKDIPGIIWRDDKREVICNEGMLPVVETLDDLPFPDYELIDLPRYWKHQSIAPVRWRKYASLLSSRGCPYQCMWCHSIFGRKIRMHSPERVVDEIEYLAKRYNICDFEFLDDTFNFNSKRVVQISELLLKKGLKTKLAFPTAIRGDLVTQEVVEAMCSVGTYLCGYSLETGSPRLQQFTCKRLDIPKFLKAVEMTAEKNIYITGFCMMGFPTETEKELEMTIDIACKSRFHTASFFTVTPFPGTPLYEWVKNNRPEKLAKINYNNMDFSAMRVNLTDLPDDVLFSYQRKAMKRFYADPLRIYRLLRAYPKPLYLPYYIPIFIHRATKGLWNWNSSP
ncbi:MAG: B12-binding domain-containing radical SAM protein [Candidatus Hydrogenedentes bacterium]|nr:B12-binding domain-containing radical SAM protein [Candidatus Hydrogenedentota bacterium]